jgi:hypothetical protein
MNKEIYLEIFNHFGWYEQRRKLQEELDELKDEILLYENGIGDIKKMIKEMADVRNVLNQFIYAYEMLEEEINKEGTLKNIRTLQKMTDKNYK